MSTYVHLACLDHDPPLLAEAESDQHRHKPGVMEQIRDWVTRRDHLIELYVDDHLDTSNYFLANTMRFLVDHRRCRIAARDENGIWLDLGHGVPGPAKGCGAWWAFDVDFDVACSRTGEHNEHLAVINGNDGVTAHITWRTA